MLMDHPNLKAVENTPRVEENAFPWVLVGPGENVIGSSRHRVKGENRSKANALTEQEDPLLLRFYTETFMVRKYVEAFSARLLMILDLIGTCLNGKRIKTKNFNVPISKSGHPGTWSVE